MSRSKAFSATGAAARGQRRHSSIAGRLTMTPVLSFKPGELNREVVSLGVEMIGEIICSEASRRVGGQVSYAVQLHGVRRGFIPAASVPAARQEIRHLVEEWLVRLGVFYPGECLTFDDAAAVPT
jgi:hypothetical protein